MRLLDTHAESTKAPEDRVVPYGTRYAILSHTWDEEEITLADLRHGQRLTEKSGWYKLHGAREQAKLDGFDFLWMDTCCIDKSSTTELSEAINSMFIYYQNAAVCYVYLADVESQGSGLLKDDYIRNGDCTDLQSPLVKLCRSRWFSRGWTLQELIAPSKVVFYDRSWNMLAHLKDISDAVSTVTGIDYAMLQQTEGDHEDIQYSLDPKDRLSTYSVAQRLSWAAGRETTREEDRVSNLMDNILSTKLASYAPLGLP